MCACSETLKCKWQIREREREREREGGGVHGRKGRKNEGQKDLERQIVK